MNTGGSLVHFLQQAGVWCVCEACGEEESLAGSEAQQAWGNPA